MGDEIAGAYRIVRRIGRGGFGAVYHATRLRTGGACALKILDPSLAEDPVQSERFRREALLVSSLRHPNTIEVYDYGWSSQGLMYMVMELLDGRSLDNVLGFDGALSPGRAGHVVMQILESLAEAHALHLIHRDLKPANIFLSTQPGDQPFVKVLDFGMAISLTSRSGRLTERGEVLGTLAYMAPEQAAEQPLSPATDIYAVGLLLYEMLVGRSPFADMTEVEILDTKMSGRPLPNIGALPESLGATWLPIIAQATASDPSARFPGAMAFYAALAGLDCVSGEFRVLKAPDSHRNPRQRIDELTQRAAQAVRDGALREGLALQRQASALLAIHAEHLLPDDDLPPRAFRELATICMEGGELGAAEDALVRALSWMDAGSPERSSAQVEERVGVHLQLAHVLELLGRASEASFHFLAVSDLAERVSEPRFHALMGLARGASARESTTDGLAFVHLAHTLAQALGRDELAALAIFEMARILGAAERVEEALEKLREGVGAGPECLPPSLAIPWLELAAELHGRLGQPGEAGDRLADALRALERAPDMRTESRLLVAMARSQLERGALDDARAFALRAVALGEEIGPSAVREARRALLEVEVRQHGFDAAPVLAGLHQIRAMFDEAGDLDGLVVFLDDIARLALASRQLDIAEHYLETSLEIQQNAQMWGQRPWTFVQLAEIELARERLAKALTLLEHGLAASTRLSEPRVQIALQLVQSRLLLAAGEVLRARAVLSAVRASARTEHMREAEACAAAGQAVFGCLTAAASPVGDVENLVGDSTSVRSGVLGWLDAIPLAQAPPPHAGVLAQAVAAVRARVERARR